MHSDERRKAIADVLRASDAPISASALAEKFSVSRQIIVGDIALLRSSGEDTEGGARPSPPDRGEAHAAADGS